MSTGYIKPKVLIIACTGPSPERPHQAVFIQKWAQQLVESGCSVRVFTRSHITFGTYFSDLSRVREYYNGSKYFQYEWDGILVDGVRIHLRMPLNYSPVATHLTWKSIRSPLLKIHEEFPFDLVYMATWGDFSLAAAKVANEIGVPYIASAIGNYENRFYNKPKSLPYRIQRELYEESKFVLCVSKDLSNKVQLMTEGQVPTIVWDSGVDTQHFSPSLERRRQKRDELGFLENDLVFTYVGRMVKEKGIYELFEAFEAVLKRKKEAKLIMVGHAHEKKYILRRIRDLGLKESVFLIGSVQASDVVNFLNATDIFVFPSWQEGLPNVVKEAASCGLPIVATNVGGIPEILEDGVSGLLVPPQTSSRLCAAMLKFAVDPKLQTSCGNTARQLVCSKFDYKVNGEMLADKIKKMLLN